MSDRTDAEGVTGRFTDDLWVADDGWRLVETGWDADRSVAVGSNFMVGNGYLGYRGTSPEQRDDGYVALVVTDTYDCADGHWRELTTAPNPLYVSVAVGDRTLAIERAEDVEMSLDLRAGEFSQRTEHRFGDATVVVLVERIAGYDELHLVAQRCTITSDRRVDLSIEAGIDGRIWSLNGTHLPAVRLGAVDGTLTATGTTVDSGVTVAVAAEVTIGGETADDPVTPAGDRITRIRHVTVGPGTPIVVETAAAVASSNDAADPETLVADLATNAGRNGYETLRAASAGRWAEIWGSLDVRIEGNALDDAALRFSAYHHRICTPAHTDHLPIGARGLSCQAYQGAAFWDQEIYNLPAFLFTEPEIARSLLVYRHRTLDGARRKAARLGYDGAYYAWISGDTGDELCPDVFFTDVLTGRPIRNHFNVWQMHIAPDIVTTVQRYVDVTGDIEFLLDHGAEIVFEVARFLRSFVRYDDWQGVYHCIRLLGPDEWHENVDDNAFTNHQTHAALSFAIDTHERLVVDHPDRLAALADGIGLTADEVDGWRRVRDRLLLPEPDEHTQLIEQFAGFFELEDILPDQLRERLIDPTEYWGWPNGIAVRTQVSKQADVATLLWLRPDRFDDVTVRANYEYYEPRCSHNSSLSHAVYGIVASRVGLLDEALEHFRATARVALLNTNHAVVAGTFIGGIHTAACSGTYQVAVHALGGLGFADGRLTIDPALPDAWTSIAYPVRWRGQHLAVTVTADGIEVIAAPANTSPVELTVRGEPATVEPGATTRST